MPASGRGHRFTAVADQHAEVIDASPVSDQPQRPGDSPRLMNHGVAGGVQGSDDQPLGATGRHHDRYREHAGDEADGDVGWQGGEEHEGDEAADDQVGDHHGGLEEPEPKIRQGSSVRRGVP
ncbi:hypothetical protein [Propioniciclava flava]